MEILINLSKKIAFLAIPIAIYCCSNNNYDVGKSHSIELKNKFEKYLNSLSFFQVELDIKEYQKDSIFIDILFLNDADSINWVKESPPFFLDKEANQMILQLFLYDNIEYLYEYDKVYIYREFQGYSEAYSTELSDLILIELKTIFSNKLFLNNVKATFSYVNYEEMLVLRKFLNELAEIIPEYNIDKPNYWDCLFCFTKYIQSKNEECTDYANMYMSLIWAIHEYLGEEQLNQDFIFNFFKQMECNGIKRNQLNNSEEIDFYQLIIDAEPNKDFLSCFEN